MLRQPARFGLLQHKCRAIAALLLFDSQRAAPPIVQAVLEEARRAAEDAQRTAENEKAAGGLQPLHTS